MRYAGPVILLISALLTAGYLLVPAFHAFYRTPDGVKEGEKPKSCEAGLWILVPLGLLAAAAILFGICFSGFEKLCIDIAYLNGIF